MPAALVRTFSVPCSTMRARWLLGGAHRDPTEVGDVGRRDRDVGLEQHLQNQLFELVEVHRPTVPRVAQLMARQLPRSTPRVRDARRRKSHVKAAISTRQETREKRAGARAQGPINAALTTLPPALAVKSPSSWLSGMPSATPSVRAAATCVLRRPGCRRRWPRQRRSPSRCPTRRRRRSIAVTTPPMTPGVDVLADHHR